MDGLILLSDSTVETGYKNILARNVSIRPYINFTSYKNIPVIRTFVSTPDDVLITGFHCIQIEGKLRILEGRRLYNKD